MFPTVALARVAAQQVTLSNSPNAIDWLTSVGTLVAALGTVGAFVIGFRQIRREETERKRLEAEAVRRERRFQAERISAWPLPPIEFHVPGYGPTAIVLSNRSEAPVYRVIVSLVVFEGPAARAGPDDATRLVEAGVADAWQSALVLLPPGQHYTMVSESHTPQQGESAVEIAFTDRAGVHWRRRANGVIEEITQAADEHYGVEPFAWAMPDERLPAWLEKAQQEAREISVERGWRARLRTWRALLVAYREELRERRSAASK